ncbi:ABC transporter permease subunit [Kangiella sp. HZ709]|uniref:ABC transporter permease subunit n=1 Tax=Kangiella sp. HZ709 TaxID=2666328 RepID=UPI0012AFF6D3|nr:ABC transporter permease subunit [Kangiella sp. HZ709]MRX28485.1 ABC transporter permease subunit [Kangiella sp. HZ709]
MNYAKVNGLAHRLKLFKAKASWQMFRQNYGAVFGAAVIIIIILLAIIGPWIAPYDPAQQFSNKSFQPPVWNIGGSFSHFLGTDDLGRDLFSRLLHGARLSLFLSAFIVFVSAIVGVLIGAFTAFLPPILRSVVMRVMDLMLSLPSLILAITVVAIIGPGITNAAYAVILVLIPQFVKITQSGISQELNKEYSMAAKLDGASQNRLLFKHLGPNIVPAIIVQITFSFSTALLDIAALGFLGLGAQPPIAEWGTMLAESRSYIQYAPWTMALPGLAIFLTILSINLLGDGLRDALDPQINQ